jgi:DNA-binding FadR family transcriptional regulator
VVVTAEKSADHGDIELVTDLDYRFHLLVAIASGNVVYPLFLNSLKEVYTNISGQFFADVTVTPFVFQFHEKLLAAIGKKDARLSKRVMTQLLSHGEERLKVLLKDE